MSSPRFLLKLNPHYNRIRRRWGRLTEIRPWGSAVTDEISTFSIMDEISTLIKGLQRWSSAPSPSPPFCHSRTHIPAMDIATRSLLEAENSPLFQNKLVPRTYIPRNVRQTFLFLKHIVMFCSIHATYAQLCGRLRKGDRTVDVC